MYIYIYIYRPQHVETLAALALAAHHPLLTSRKYHGSQGKILRTRNHKVKFHWKMPLEMQWTIPMNKIITIIHTTTNNNDNNNNDNNDNNNDNSNVQFQ